jgi:beta-fructofuranosidase
VDQITLSDTPSPSPQAQFIREAGEFLESKAAIASKDPLRPIYHVMPKSQSIGDPNGPVFFDGEYHIFYQGMPFWGTGKSGTGWGHAVSRDMVRWEHLPMAMAPGPGSYDSAGVWSGGCVIHNGVPTIIYSGNGGDGQTQCIATSSDKLRTWTKDPANPVIQTLPPIEGLDRAGFRDPFTWREGDEWRMLVGAGYAKGKGGTVLLYRSNDLRKWDFLGTLCEGMGENCFMWECPTFFPLDNKHMLIVSPLFRNVRGLRGFTQYSTGTYRNNRFEPDGWKPLDLGGPGVFYAATSFADPKNRRIVWGFIMTPQPPAAGWSNCLSLPRLVTAGKDSGVNFAPLPELSALRTRERDCGNPVLKQDDEVVLDGALGLHAEVAVEIDMKTADKIELRIGRTADGRDYVPLSYDKTSGNLVFGDKKAEFRLDADNRLRIHLFTDGVVAEAFINDKTCFSNAMPVTEKSVGLSIVASKGSARITWCRLWEMTSIW